MSAYEIKVSVTPLCPSCGKESHPGSFMAESRAPKGVFDRDNPYERTDQRVFVQPCTDCFVFRGDVAELIDVVSQFDSYKSSDFGDTSILDNEDLWNRLSAALARVEGA